MAIQVRVIEKEVSWLPVKDYEGIYEVSNTGEVRSLDRKNNGTYRNSFVKGKMLSPRTDKDGYYRLSLSKNGKKKYFRVNRLVADAFLDNTKNFPVTNHKNNIKTDNRVENLEWCSISHNTKHGYMFHKHKAGEEWCVSKLRNNEALKIRKYFGVLAVSPIELSKMFNVSVSTIRNIIKNRTY